jgi:hypothetical protein
METKASMVVMSHLSDAQECIGICMSQENAHKNINFAKFVILETDGDLNMMIDADSLWEKFNKR